MVEKVSKERTERTNEPSTHLASKGDVNLGDATGGHSRSGVESAELLNKGLREGRVGLELIKLVGVLQKSDNSLEKTKEERVKDGPRLGSFQRIRAYQVDHVNHSGISGNEHQEGDLDGVRLLDVSGDELKMGT
jgi:hypothetical protein